MLPALVAQAITRERWVEADVLEVKAGAPLPGVADTKHELGAGPFVLARDGVGGDVCKRALPAHFAARLEPLDAHVLVRGAETKVEYAVDPGGAPAIAGPPGAQAFDRGERCVHRGRCRRDGQALLVVVHVAPPITQISDHGTDALAKVELQKLEFEKEKHARERWWHEDCLVNQRTTWLIQIEGVLGAAYSFLRYRVVEVAAGIVQGMGSTSKPTLETSNYLATLNQFERALQFVGTSFSILLLVGIVAARNAQVALQRQHPQYFLGVTHETTGWGHIASVAIPTVCVAAWVFSFIL
jgi:hypothetical protein